MHHKITNEAEKIFIADKAYRVKVHKGNDGRYFVRALGSNGKFSQVGTLTLNPSGFFQIRNSNQVEAVLILQGIAGFFCLVYEELVGGIVRFQFDRGGRCRRCGRKISDSKSIDLGFGPTCHKNMLKGTR